MHHTPYLQGSFNPAKVPVTPFTPAVFTAKQGYFFHDSTDIESSIYLLDESDNPLAALYNQILRFISRDLKPIMDIADRFRVKGQHNPMAALVIDEDTELPEEEKSFDILPNVIWVELASVIMDNLGSQVFAVGKPNEFKKVRNLTSYRQQESLSPSYRTTRRRRALSGPSNS